MGQEIEVRPGIVSKDSEGKLMCKPIFSKIVSLFAEHNDLQYAAPGGLIGKAFPLIPTGFFVCHFILFFLKDNYFTEFCCFLSNINKNQHLMFNDRAG